MARKRKAEVIAAPDEGPIKLPTGDWLTAIPLEEIEPQLLSWLWPQRVAVGCPALMEGRKGGGKSTICAALAAMVTGGKPLPAARKHKPAGVLWIAGEEPLDTVVRPRLAAAGADLSRVHIPGADYKGQFKQRPTLPSCIGELMTLAEKTGAKLLVVDPIGAWVDSGVALESDEGARLMMNCLAEWAQRAGGCVVATRNLTKGRGGDALSQGRYSGTLGDAARSILRVDPHPESKGLYLLSQVRNSHGAVAPSLQFRLQVEGEGVRVAWEGTTEVTADQLAEASSTPADLEERLDARQLVRRAVGARWRSVREIQAEALAAGIGWRSVQQARVELGVPSRRVGGAGAAGSWEWGPPPAGWPKTR